MEYECLVTSGMAVNASADLQAAIGGETPGQGPPASPRAGRAAEQPTVPASPRATRASGQPILPPIFQSPRKRPSSGAAAEEGGASDCQPRCCGLTTGLQLPLATARRRNGKQEML